MIFSTITSKGQTTIPIEIRQFLNIHAGDKLEFLKEDGKVRIIPATLDISELKGTLPKPKKPLSLEAMQHAIGPKS